MPTYQQCIVCIAVLLATACLARVYRLLVPRPLPGIPYNPSSKALLGDIPALMKYQTETGKFFDFMRHRCLQLQSPIVQIFPKPWQTPWIVVCDAQETIDILSRRSSEFDRPDFISESLQAVVPNSQLVLKTGSEWRRHRRLAAETMSQRFLDTITRVHIQPRFEDLIRLWSEKARLAEGRPFSFAEDVFETVLDSVWAAAFGSLAGVTISRADQLAKLDQLKILPVNVDHPAVFPAEPVQEDFKAFLHVMDSLEIFFKVPIMAGLVHKIAATVIPSLRRSFSRIDTVIKSRITQACETIKQNGSESRITCAADALVHQEIDLARKQNRKIDAQMLDTRGELLTFVLGSLEATSATICWALKFLTSDQVVQLRLKTALKAIHSPEDSFSPMPTAETILTQKVPYLDAVVEEVLRCSGTIQALSRQAVVDTQIFGYFIPKGTQVYFPVCNMSGVSCTTSLMIGKTTGPSYRQPAFDIDLKKRSATSQETASTFQNWRSDDINQFKPERWLKSDESGQPSFDQQAGFQPAFGSGVRRCFGMKLARNMIKIVLAYTILSFDLESIPAALSSFEGVDKSIYSARQAYIRISR